MKYGDYSEAMDELLDAESVLSWYDSLRAIEQKRDKN
jgi:hypothetical protein